MLKTGSIKPHTCSLVLHKKWFDMIASGKKKEEYRDITQYFISRLFILNSQAAIGPLQYFKTGRVRIDWQDGKPVESIRFFDGYAKDRRHMLIAVTDITTGVGLKKWGATDYSFIIKLGEILEKS